MMADWFCHERYARFEARVRELRDRRPEPEIEARVTPVEIERRSLLEAVLGPAR